MSEKFAGLTLTVDVSQVDSAAKSLDNFKAATAKAASGVSDFVDAEQAARIKAKQSRQEFEDQRKTFLDLQKAIDPTAAKILNLKDAATQLDNLWKKGGVPDDKFFELGSMIETQINKLELSKLALTEEGRAAIEESKAKAKAAAEGQKFIASLQAQEDAIGKTRSELLEMKAAQLGVSEQAAPFIAKMRETEKQMHLSGITAGQYTQAMRQLPMQITDVVTSLASGMPIWMVAIQQGGQIKDSFGGIANTLAVLKQFITPVTVGATALGAGLAYLAYNAYKTDKQIQEIKKSIQDTTGLTGQFASDLSVAIQRISDATGKSAEDITKAYITTKDGAREAINKLVAVGMSYDDAREKVAQYKSESNFVTLNNEIADHMTKIADLGQSWLDLIEKKKAYISPTGGLATAEFVHFNVGLAVAKQTYADLEQVIKDTNEHVANTAESIEKQYFSTNRVAAAEKELNELLKQQRTLSYTNDKEAKQRADWLVNAKRKEIEELKKQQEKKPKEKKSPIVRSVTEQLDKELYTLQAQLRTLKEHRAVTDVISNQRRTLWATEKQIEVLQEVSKKRALSLGEQKLLAEQQSILAMARQKAELGDQIVLQERKNKLEQDSLNFIQQTTSAMDTLALRGKGLTDEQVRRAQEIQRIITDYAAKGGDVNDGMLQAMIDKQIQYYQKEDQLRLDWRAGAKAAFEEYGQEAFNMYQNVGEIASASLNGLSEQMTQFLTTGKASFADFAGSIIKMIIQMITKMVIFNALSGLGFGSGKTFSFAGGFGFASGGYTGDGGKYEPAGVVHKGEFVFTKEATNRIGTENLYRLMRGYANGGQVGASSYGGGSVYSGASQFNFGDINVNVNNGNDPKGMETGVRMIVQDVLKRSCMQGGEIYNFVNSRRG